MSESLASHLKLARYSQHIIVEGAYGGGNSKHFVQAMLQSLDNPSQSITLKFSVIPKLKTSQSPHCKHDIHNKPSLNNLKLADPDLGGPLDIIICSINRCKCVTKEFNYFPKPKLAATKTIFGWTITGPLESKSSSPPVLQMQSKKTLYRSHWNVCGSLTRSLTPRHYLLTNKQWCSTSTTLIGSNLIDHM